MSRRIAAIVNPAAGGRALRALSELSRRVPGIEIRSTERPNHATALTGELLREGFGCIVATGGDGTVNEIVNGFFEGDALIAPEAALAVLPLGTGGDFRRCLGVRTVEDTAAAIARWEPAAVDVGRIRYTGAGGEPGNRYFANVVSFGMGGEVAARARNPLRAVGGKTAFFYATMEVFLRYRARTVELELDGRVEGTHRILNVAVGNGRYHGGGMHVCPRASMTDGLLEVTVIESLSLVELVRGIRVLYSDNVYAHPKTRHYRARCIRARSGERVSIEVDGEPLGRLPVEIGVLPRALPLLFPPGLPV